MNSLSVTDSSEDLRLASKSIDPLEEHWFDATPPSGRGRPASSSAIPRSTAGSVERSRLETRVRAHDHGSSSIAKVRGIGASVCVPPGQDSWIRDDPLPGQH